MKSLGWGLLLVFVVLFASDYAEAIPLIPNPEIAQGSLCTREHRDYERDRYSQKIPYCRRGVDSSLKRRLYDIYNIPEKCRKHYTIDHIIPLSIGGDNSPENLWPEHRRVKATRPRAEDEVFVAVRDNDMTQKEAVEWILSIKFNPVKPPSGSSPCDKF